MGGVMAFGKRSLAVLFAGLLFTLAGVSGAQSQAFYTTACRHYATWTSTSVTVSEINDECRYVQARTERYYAGVRVITADPHPRVSYVSDSNGTLTRHYHNALGWSGSWQGWKRV